MVTVEWVTPPTYSTKGYAVPTEECFITDGDIPQDVCIVTHTTDKYHVFLCPAVAVMIT